MPANDMSDDSIVRYFAELLAARAGVPLSQAAELVEEPIRDELRTSEERGLHRLDVPLGQAMAGRAVAPDMHTILYVEQIRAQDADRWTREGVTEDDIIAWYNLGGIMQGAYVAFDNFFNMAQVVTAVQSRGFGSAEEAVAYGQWSLAKYFPLYGPDNGDIVDGRLPHELRFRIEAWLYKMRRESPDVLLAAAEASCSFNAVCRYMIQRGEI